MTVSTGCQLTSYPTELPNAVAAYVTTNVKHVFKCSNIKLLFLMLSVRQNTRRRGYKWKKTG